MYAHSRLVEFSGLPKHHRKELAVDRLPYPASPPLRIVSIQTHSDTVFPNQFKKNEVVKKFILATPLDVV